MADDPDKPPTDIFLAPEDFNVSFNPIRDGCERYMCRKSVSSNLGNSGKSAKLLILEFVPNSETRCLPFLFLCHRLTELIDHRN